MNEHGDVQNLHITFCLTMSVFDYSTESAPMVEIDSWIRESTVGGATETSRVLQQVSQTSEHMYTAYGDEPLTTTTDTVDPHWMNF